jgi:hypothetical protein
VKLQVQLTNPCPRPSIYHYELRMLAQSETPLNALLTCSLPVTLAAFYPRVLSAPPLRDGLLPPAGRNRAGDKLRLPPLRGRRPRTRPAKRSDIRRRTGSKYEQLQTWRRENNAFWPKLSRLENRWTWIVVCAGGGWCASWEGLKTCLCGLGEGKCILVEGESRETTVDNKVCSDAECSKSYSC